MVTRRKKTTIGTPSYKVRLERAKKDLARLRDELRTISEEMDELKDVSERAYDDLESCIDALSERV